MAIVLECPTDIFESTTVSHAYWNDVVILLHHVNGLYHIALHRSDDS